jgi:hypothetical protein
MVYVKLSVPVKPSSGAYVHVEPLLQSTVPPSVDGFEKLVIVSRSKSASVSLARTSRSVSLASATVYTSSTASGGTLTASVTVTGAVGPVPTTASVPPSAVAWLRYSPGVSATVTEKWIETDDIGPTANGPVQVSTSPTMDGSAVVAPLVEPAR